VKHVLLGEYNGSIGTTTQEQFDNWLNNARAAMQIAGLKEAKKFYPRTYCACALWTVGGEQFEGFERTSLFTSVYKDEREMLQEISIFPAFYGFDMCQELSQETLTVIASKIKQKIT